MKYPVRCCCEPTKIYGYLELPGELKSGSMAVVQERVPLKLPVFWETSPNETTSMTPSAPRHFVELMRVVDRSTGLDEVAVYSDDRPIEFWRRIVGFTEFDSRPCTFHTTDVRIIDICGRYQEAQAIVTINVDGREVTGKVEKIDYVASRGWTDITIAEMVPVENGGS